MKTTFTKALAVALLIVAMAAVSVTATGTLAGTLINNNATVNYKDVNSNSKAPVTSNTVTTTVNPVCGVDVTPDAGYSETVEDKIREYAFTIINTGNDYDSFSLTLSGVPAGWNSVIYLDANGNGVLDPGETTVTSSTGVLDPTSPTIIGHTRVDSYNVIVQVTAPSAPIVVNQTANITLTATCTHAPVHPSPKTDSSTIAMTVRQAIMSVTKTSDNYNPMPLEPFAYTITVLNSGLVQAYDVVVTDTLSGNLSFIGPVWYDADGPGATAPVSLPSAYSAGVITVSIPSLGAGVTATITFDVQVTAEVPYTTEIVNFANVAYDDWNDYHFSVADDVTITVANRAGVDIEAYYTMYTDPGDVLMVPFTIQNTGNGPDVMEITTSQTGALALTWTFYFDADASGTYTTGDTLIVNTNASGGIDTGSMTKDQLIRYVAVATVPAGAVDATIDALTITATTTTAPITHDAITITHTVKAPILTITKAVDKATADPGETLTYTITVTNIGTGNATGLVITDDINAILAYVDFVAGSIEVDGVAPVAPISATYTAGVITVNIPTIDGTLAIGPNVDYVITFQVTIK